MNLARLHLASEEHRRRGLYPAVADTTATHAPALARSEGVGPGLVIVLVLLLALAVSVLSAILMRGGGA